MSTLIGERASQPFCFAWFQHSGQGMDEDLASQRIDPPRLTTISARARGTGDVPRERPHGGIGSVGANEADAGWNKWTGSRDLGQGVTLTRSERHDTT